MTQLLHSAPGATDFDLHRQVGELDNVVGTRARRTYLAERVHRVADTGRSHVLRLRAGLRARCARGTSGRTLGESGPRFVGPHCSAGGAVTGTAGRLHDGCPALRQSDPGRGRLSRALVAAALVVGLAACTVSQSGAGAPTSGPGEATTATTGVGVTPKPPVSRSYRMAEAPDVVDRDAYAFRTLDALRPGATYRLRMPGNLYPTAPGSHLAVELTPSGDIWWLFEQGVVTQVPSYVREDAGIRVMELDVLPYGPCQAQATPPADPGPTPGDLARAILSRYPFTVLERLAPVTRFGGSGVHLVARLDDPDASLCDNKGVMTYRPMAAQHQFVELWIVVVQGERVVVERSWFSDTSPRVVADQQRTLDSLRLVRV